MYLLNRSYLIFVVLLMTWGCSSPEAPKAKAALMPGFKNLLLNDTSGNRLEHDEFAGKAVVVNVWATWCKPCREEMPSFASAIRTINDTSIAFLFVSPEETSEIINFIAGNDYPFTYAQLVNPTEFRVMALPTTMIFDRTGKMVFSEMGYRQWDTPENIGLIRKKCQ